MGWRAFRALRLNEPYFFKVKTSHDYAIFGIRLFTLFEPLTILDVW